MPQDAGHAFCRWAMTCASEFASAFCGAIYISRYYYYYHLVVYKKKYRFLMQILKNNILVLPLYMQLQR